MNRENLAACALLALPGPIRASRGEEILGTLLDTSGSGSRMRFTGELVNLLHTGLRARTASRSPRRLAADGLCRGAILVMTLDLSTLLAQRLSGLQDPLLTWPSIVSLAMILAIALIGAERLAGAAALAWVAIRFPQLVSDDPTFHGIAPTIVPLVCFTVLILAPRRRGLDLRRLVWLAATAALVAAYGHWHGTEPITAVVSAAALMLMLAAVLTITSDPRLAIACALPASYVALMVAGKPALPAVLLLLVPPIVTTAIICARRQAQRSTAI
ncbi:MAG: hypothetical protein ACR2NR_17265 [Solirubrobacteraceae bacterium]